MRAEPGERVLYRGHPSWLSMTGFVVRGLAFCLVAGLVAGVAAAAADGRPRSGLVVAAVLAAFVAVALRGQGRRMRTTYVLTDRRACVRRGLVARTVKEASLEWVVGVDVHQSVIGRLLGTGTVRFDCAGEVVWFRGVDDPQRLVRLVRLVEVRRGEVERWEEPVLYATPPAA